MECRKHKNFQNLSSSLKMHAAYLKHTSQLMMIYWVRKDLYDFIARFQQDDTALHEVGL